MEVGEYELTRGTCFVASRLKVLAVAGLLWISWFVLGGEGFLLCFSGIYIFKFVHVYTIAGCERPRAVSVDSVKGLRQPANLPTENSRPHIPTRYKIYCTREKNGVIN